MIYSYKEITALAEQIANQLQMKPKDFLKKLEQHRRILKNRQDVFLYADLEFRRSWLPENRGHLFGMNLAKTTKLLPKPKYEFTIGPRLGREPNLPAAIARRLAAIR